MVRWGEWECPVCGEEHEDPECGTTHCRRCGAVVTTYWAYEGALNSVWKGKFIEPHDTVPMVLGELFACSCGNTLVIMCEQCHTHFCMDCYCKYEVKAVSRLCWMCQHEADMEWLADDCKHPRRTWPRIDK